MHSSNTAGASRQDGSSKPRRTRVAATAVATTVGAAAVVTTALAPAAQAKSHHTVWDRVASCESGNNWHINTGNGYYGGLQFSSGTWRAHGGHKYAGKANNASRAEQIEVARRVLASQGRNAWPVCGPRAGLTKQTGHATRRKLPKNAGVLAGDSTQHASKAKHHKHTAKHRASTGHHKTYRVHSGDTLVKIANKKHVHGGWHALYRANRSHMSSPNVLHVGQRLTLP